MGPWWTRDQTGRLESLDEGWLAARIHQAGQLAGIRLPDWPLWQSELAAGAAHFLEEYRAGGEVLDKEDLVGQVVSALRELGHPVLAARFSDACQTGQSDRETDGASTETSTASWADILGPDLGDLTDQGLIRPLLPRRGVEFSGPFQAAQARLFLPGCPDVSRALVRLIQVAQWCWGEIHLVGAAQWLEELGMGPGRGLEAFDLLEEAAAGLGRPLRIHLAMGPGSAPVQGQMGLFFFGNAQGLREPTLALQRWLADPSRKLFVTGWLPGEGVGDPREVTRAMVQLAELARPGRPVQVVRFPQSPDLLANWGPGRKPVEAILGGLELPWNSLANHLSRPGALEQWVGIAVKAGARLRQKLRTVGKTLWPHSDSATLWRMGWIIRFSGDWPIPLRDQAFQLAVQAGTSSEIPVVPEIHDPENYLLLDAHQWRTGNRLLPEGEGPWMLSVRESSEPEFPEMSQYAR